MGDKEQEVVDNGAIICCIWKEPMSFLVPDKSSSFQSQPILLLLLLLLSHSNFACRRDLSAYTRCVFLFRCPCCHTELNSADVDGRSKVMKMKGAAHHHHSIKVDSSLVLRLCSSTGAASGLASRPLLLLLLSPLFFCFETTELIELVISGNLINAPSP